MGNPWDKYVTERDRSVIEAGGWGGKMGFPKRPVVIVIDVSIGFCGLGPESADLASQRFPTSCGEAAWEALPNIQKILAAARSRGVPIIYTTGKWREDGWDSGAWRWKQVRDKGIAPPADVPNVDPNEIMPQIAPEPQDIVILKQKPSAFFGTNLIGYLNLMGCDGLVVAGCSSSGCVRATAVDASSHNYRVTVAHDACFDRFDVSHAIAMFDLHTKYADVATTHDVVASLSTIPAHQYSDAPDGS